MKFWHATPIGREKGEPHDLADLLSLTALEGVVFLASLALNLSPMRAEFTIKQHAQFLAQRVLTSPHRNRIVPVLEVLSGPQRGACLPLSRWRRYLVGRATESDLRLTDADCSRRHLEVIHQRDHTVVRDIGSTHGVIINGIYSISTYRLLSGDTLRIGQTTLRFVVPAGTTMEHTPPLRSKPSQQVQRFTASKASLQHPRKTYAGPRSTPRSLHS